MVDSKKESALNLSIFLKPMGWLRLQPIGIAGGLAPYLPLMMGVSKPPPTLQARSVGEVAPVVLERVVNADQRKQWKQLVSRHHYLGYKVPFGAHLRYLIKVSRPEPRVVGCLQFSSPAWRIKARDGWIGWDDTTRANNLQRIVNNSRFLILPYVNVPNLASHALSLATKQIAEDWFELYRIRPRASRNTRGSSPFQWGMLQGCQLVGDRTDKRKGATRP
ncbi:MAG: Druantia anti-phage system protein DruA [Verrucomicrobiota bacterium]